MSSGRVRTRVFLPLALWGCSAPERYAGGISSLVGGRPAEVGELPASVLLSLGGKDREGYCTGTRVGPTAILTAAHCVTVRSNTEEVLKEEFKPGATLWLSNSTYVKDETDAKENGWRRARVKQTYSYPGFSKTRLEVTRGLPDVAVIEVEASDACALSGMAEASVRITDVPYGTRVVINGYGLQKYDPSANDESKPIRNARLKLKETVLERIPFEHLRAAAYDSEYIERANYVLGHLDRAEYPAVADGDELAILEGDSGGAMFVAGAPRPTVIGINRAALRAEWADIDGPPRLDSYVKLSTESVFDAGSWLSSLPVAVNIEGRDTAHLDRFRRCDWVAGFSEISHVCEPFATAVSQLDGGERPYVRSASLTKNAANQWVWGVSLARMVRVHDETEVQRALRIDLIWVDNDGNLKRDDWAAMFGYANWDADRSMPNWLRDHLIP